MDQYQLNMILFIPFIAAPLNDLLTGETEVPLDEILNDVVISS